MNHETDEANGEEEATPCYDASDIQVFEGLEVPAHRRLSARQPSAAEIEARKAADDAIIERVRAAILELDFEPMGEARTLIGRERYSASEHSSDVAGLAKHSWHDRYHDLLFEHRVPSSTWSEIRREVLGDGPE